MQRKVKVDSQRNVITYAEFWHTSSYLLEMAKKVDEGQYHLIMSSLVFKAFTIEAYFNHVGRKIFDDWKDVERNLSPKNKLDKISKKFEIKIDYGCRPWQLIDEIFTFRNDIAHGKSLDIVQSETVAQDKYDKGYDLKTEWEKYCTMKNLERADKEISNIVHMIHDAANLTEEYPFVMGFAYGSAKLIE